MIKTVKLPENDREIFEISRIQENDDFISLQAMIKRAEIQAKNYCVTYDGAPLYRAQGAATVLKELLDALDDARRINVSPFKPE